MFAVAKRRFVVRTRVATPSFGSLVAPPPSPQQHGAGLGQWALFVEGVVCARPSVCGQGLRSGWAVRFVSWRHVSHDPAVGVENAHGGAQRLFVLPGTGWQRVPCRIWRRLFAAHCFV